MHPRRIGEGAGRLVEQQGARVPGVPQRQAGFDGFLGTVVSRDTIGDRVHAEIARLHVGGRGDDVPGDTPAAQMVERGQHPCQVERMIEAGGQRDAEAEMRGGPRDIGQHHQRIEQVDLPAAPEDGFVAALVGVIDAREVLEEAGVEAAFF